jgi:predicted CopG family antitoxin
MQTIKIPLEWYEIILRISHDRKQTFSETLNSLMNTEECLGLSYVKPTSYKKVNVDLEVDEGKPVRKIERFLFCR